MDLASKDRTAAPSEDEKQHSPETTACCVPSQQETCCAPTEKAECCGTAKTEGRCGCR